MYFTNFNEVTTNYYKFMDTNPFAILNNITLYNKGNHILIFHTIEYIHDILKSYDFDINNIKQQFDQDIKRTELHYNGQPIETIKHITHILNKYKAHRITINKIPLSLTFLCITLCTQAAFSNMYGFMCVLYNDLKNNNYVTSGDTHYNITDNNEILSIDLNCQLNVKNSINNNISKIIDAKTTIKIDVINSSVLKFSTLEWSIKN